MDRFNSISQSPGVPRSICKLDVPGGSHSGLKKQTYRFAIHSQVAIKHKSKLLVCLLLARAITSQVCFFFSQFVTSPGVEPGFWVPETHVISIIRRGYMEKAKLGVFLPKISCNASSTNRKFERTANEEAHSSQAV